MARRSPAPQTLLQPDLKTSLILTQEIPVPAVVLWSPHSIPVKKLIAPAPQPPSSADAHPRLDSPNSLENLADVSLSAAPLARETVTILSGTTSPVAVHGPDPAQKIPETASKPAAQPTPARIVSVSDLRMHEGTVPLPAVNETAAAASPAFLAPSRQASAAQPGRASEPGTGNGSSSGSGAGGREKSLGRGEAPSANSAIAEKARSTESSLDTARAGAGPQTRSKQAPGAEPSPAPAFAGKSSRIALPKDGRFGVVVIGSSVAEKYPETADLWSGRTAYTVYLHVGLARNWILQYSLTRQDDAAAAGNAVRPDAPWPYDIVRPNLAPGDTDADALMIHGIINKTGRFEALTLAFPPQFPLSRFVLESLQQWQFRPAMQNGQPTAVEVLLVIPADSE